MKNTLLLMDDIHLETRTYANGQEFLELINNKVADIIQLGNNPIVVLAGDIGEGINGAIWAKNINCNVIYVAGNHEHYNQDYFNNIIELKKITKNSNVSFLHNDSVVINGIKFIGGTLWTDLGRNTFKQHSIIADYASSMMNDFNYINAESWYSKKNNLEKFTQLKIESSLSTANNKWNSLIQQEENEKTTNYIKNELNKDFFGDVVVVSHHLPLKNSLTVNGFDKSFYEPIKHNDNYFYNCKMWRVPHHENLIYAVCYSNNYLQPVFYNSTTIPQLWLHGHSHQPVDYFFRKTRVVSNPIGYSHQSLNLYIKEITIEDNFQLLNQNLSNQLILSNKTFNQDIQNSIDVISKTVELYQNKLIDFNTTSSILHHMEEYVNNQVDIFNENLKKALFQIGQYFNPTLDSHFLSTIDESLLFSLSKINTLTKLDQYEFEKQQFKFISKLSFLEINLLSLQKDVNTDEYDFPLFSHYTFWINQLNEIKNDAIEQKEILIKYFSKK